LEPDLIAVAHRLACDLVEGPRRDDAVKARHLLESDFRRVDPDARLAVLLADNDLLLRPLEYDDNIVEAGFGCYLAAVLDVAEEDNAGAGEVMLDRLETSAWMVSVASGAMVICGVCGVMIFSGGGRGRPGDGGGLSTCGSGGVLL
jgi:hypothetical protein